jgi:hypothetical protein
MMYMYMHTCIYMYIMYIAYFKVLPTQDLLLPNNYDRIAMYNVHVQHVGVLFYRNANEWKQTVDVMMYFVLLHIYVGHTERSM